MAWMIQFDFHPIDVFIWSHTTCVQYARQDARMWIIREDGDNSGGDPDDIFLVDLNHLVACTRLRRLSNTTTTVSCPGGNILLLFSTSSEAEQFHDRDDQLVPISRTRPLVDDLRSLGLTSEEDITSGYQRCFLDNKEIEYCEFLFNEGTSAVAVESPTKETMGSTEGETVIGSDRSTLSEEEFGLDDDWSGDDWDEDDSSTLSKPANKEPFKKTTHSPVFSSATYTMSTPSFIPHTLFIDTRASWAQDPHNLGSSSVDLVWVDAIIVVSQVTPCTFGVIICDAVSQDGRNVRRLNGAQFSQVIVNSGISDTIERNPTTAYVNTTFPSCPFFVRFGTHLDHLKFSRAVLDAKIGVEIQRLETQAGFEQILRGVPLEESYTSGETSS
ncbi:hypothetical protein C8Q80DRAFT_1122902 [Daedaleopsis nitida]|nr:hypothetical protein C8Q80DRAFT_1122902 [Daedaleopsis nitida]